MNEKITEALHIQLSLENILEAIESAQKGIERDEKFFAEHPDKELSERMLTARDYELAKMLYRYLVEDAPRGPVDGLFTELYLILTHGIDFTVQVLITDGCPEPEDEIRKELMKHLKTMQDIACSIFLDGSTAA